MGYNEMVIDRIDLLEANVKEHFEMCQKVCLSRIEHIEQSNDKAHERLDRQKDSIECLCKHKNEEIGARKATKFYMGGVLFIVAILGLFVAFYK